MPRLEISDERIKAIVLIKLRNKGCWGARYTQLDSPMHWRISSCRLWLEAGSLEEAYRLYERWLRAKKLLESAGVKIEMANESSQRSMAILREETHIAHTRF
jgi:hypothetical protein